MRSDGEFNRCYDHGKPWRNPMHKPGKWETNRNRMLRRCSSCAVTFRNEAEELRHVERTRFWHPGSELASARSKRGWKRWP